MSVPQKIFFYFIVDAMSRSLFVDNGVVKRSSPPVPLPQHPRGWMDTQISFGTNQKYWSLNRSFSVPMFFIGDGATICREAIYSGKGYEEELYIIILKKNLATGIYDLEYKGRLDFSKHQDEPRKGISVNSIEGGVLSFLNANDAVAQEIKMDNSNDDALEIGYDGINLADRYRYSVVELDIIKPNDFDHHTVVNTLAFPFISNDGDSVGIIRGSQLFAEVVATGTFAYSMINPYVSDPLNANYFLSTINPIVLTFSGQIIFDVFPSGGADTNVHIFFIKQDGTRFDILPLTAYSADTHVELDVNNVIALAANERLFLMVLAASNSVATTHITWRTSDVYIAFNSKNPYSTARGLEPLSMLKQLVSKMSNGACTADSMFFRTHKNIIMTSTESLRHFVGDKIQMTFEQWFNDYDCIYNLGMKVVNNVLWVEPKADLYNESSEILDLGEVAELKIKYAEELLCNNAKFGYKSQDYRQSNGKYEFNTTTEFKFPVNTIKREYTKICKSRGDCYGQEFVRSMLFDKPTTDTTGDNQPFLVNVEPAQPNVTVSVDFLASNNSMTVPNTVRAVQGDIIQVTGSALNDDTRTVVSVIGFPGFYMIIFTGGAPIVDQSAVVVNLIWTRSKAVKVKRAAYSAITGVLDNTVYNIEEMTPHRMLLAHGNSIKSLLIQQPAGEITFQTADKNSDLVTTLAGLTIAERQTEVVANLKDILYYPFYLQFKTPVPLSFAKIMASISTGYIPFTFYGVRLYALPIGNMDAKVATNEAQSWSLIAAPPPLNSLATLKQLSFDGNFYTDAMGNSLFISDLNPLHFVKYNYALDLKYQHKEIYDDQFQNRAEDFATQAYYLQKWQKTDVIPIQAISRGLGTINVHVYDQDGNQVTTFPMAVTSDPAVQLPYVLLNASIDLSTYAEGNYFVVLECAGTNLFISEYQNVAEKQEKTLLFEYSHTTNKYNTYFGAFAPMIRVEGLMLPWFPDSTFENYTDELADSEVLDGIPVGKRNIRLGNGYGIPDYLGLKMNKILLLNRCDIEGVRYSRTPDSKFTKKEQPGHNMNSYMVEVSKAINKNGVSVNAEGVEEDMTVVATLSAQAFGSSDPNSVINIEVPND